MSLSASLTLTYTRGGDQIMVTQSLSGEAASDVSVTIAAEAANVEVTWPLIVAQAKLVLITCDQAVTIKTNSSGAPDDTLALAANVPILWQTENAKDGLDLPLFDITVTKLYVSNVGLVEAHLEIRCLLDATP